MQIVSCIFSTVQIRLFITNDSIRLHVFIFVVLRFHLCLFLDLFIYTFISGYQLYHIFIKVSECKFKTTSSSFTFLFFLEKMNHFDLSDHFCFSVHPSGKSTVEFECVKETDLILIHSNKLNYTTLSNTHTAPPPGVKSSWLQPQTQYLVIQLNSRLTVGQKYQLYTEFTGELADDLAGFYRSEYEEDGVRKIVATSQMHPTHARKTFPCFDEPAMKAVFYMDTHSPPRNCEIVNTTIDGVAVTQTEFEPTSRMSSYLLAIIICDYTYVSATQGDILVRIWARRTAIDQGQGNYALNVTGPVLNFLQSYYNISYPLCKSDQIALPDFYFGAMENWGLVTYRETRLLYDPSTSSNRNKETTATIIAHELAHMWFGNLVTLRWWNEVWLNEGFATYVSYLGADHAEPSWNVKDLIILNDVHRVFAVDALTSSHPLSSEEDSIVLPDQIIEQFDVISYSKGAAVLRMLSDFLSESVFVQGLNVPNNVSLPRPVYDIMNRWVLQMGFPVVTIDTTTGQVSQKHFLLDAESNVTVESPYKYATPEQFIIKCLQALKEGVSRVMPMNELTGGSWVLANVNVTGFYRVNYDLGNWERLLAQLQSEHQVIPVINRAQLVDDAFNLARARLVSTTLALRTTSYLLVETEYIPWQSALDNLHYYYLMLDRTDVYQPMQDYVKKLVTPLFLHFKNVTSNWTRVPDRLTDQYNQVNAISMACSTGVTECQNLTTAWFKQWMENPQNNLIDPNLRSAVYCSAVAAGDEAEWEFGWSQFEKATVASEASKLMSALACTANERLLKRYLSYTLNPERIRKQDATSVITAVASNRAGQTASRRFRRVDKREDSSSELFPLVSPVRQLQQFVEEQNGAAGFGSASLAVDQAVERTGANIAWLQQNKEEVGDWFNGQTGPQTH
uniref:Aminopeptidase n=1 Tax=Scophthalmus maximus TaxID=52904 RepID=A0A8D3EG09_SCOMX